MWCVERTRAAQDRLRSPAQPLSPPPSAPPPSSAPLPPHCALPARPAPPHPARAAQIGPGMFALSALFQQAGWLPSIALMLLVAVWTSQSSLYMAQTMAAFKGNARFEKRLEMGNTMFHLLPRWAYYLSMLTLCTVFFSQNLANIVVTSQVMDYTLLAVFGRTCGLDYTQLRAYCVTPSDSTGATNSPFGDAYILTMGYSVVLLLCIPLGMLNLDDNIGMQVGGMVLTVVCVVVWLCDFTGRGLHAANMPALPPNYDAYPTLLSTVLFNYGFVATIPSWLNEKAHKVQVAPTVWWAVLFATAQFLLVSVPAALAVANLPGSCSLLAVINGTCNVPDANGVPLAPFWEVSKIMVFIFPIANILTSIPVFSIIIRYNMLQIHGVRVPVWLSNIFAVVLPWVVALPFFGGDGLNNIINWSSAVFFILLNLILPLWAYLQHSANVAAGRPPIDSEIEEQQQQQQQSSGGAGSRGVKSFADANELLMREASASLLAHDESKTASLLDSLYDEEGGSGSSSSSSGASRGLGGQGAINRGGGEDEGEEEGGSGEGKISAMPWCCGVHFSAAVERWYAYGLLVIAIALAIATFALQVYLTVDPPPSDDDDGCVWAPAARAARAQSRQQRSLALTRTYTHMPSYDPPRARAGLAAAATPPPLPRAWWASSTAALATDSRGVWVVRLSFF